MTKPTIEQLAALTDSFRAQQTRLQVLELLPQTALAVIATDKVLAVVFVGKGEKKNQHFQQFRFAGETEQKQLRSSISVAKNDIQTHPPVFKYFQHQNKWL